MTSTQTLHSWGRVSWERVMELLDGTTSAWADYNGFEIGSCPQQAPAYSHLWAWAPEWQFRVRIDGIHGFVSAVTTSSAPPTVSPESSQSVAVRTSGGIPWKSDDGQVGAQARSVLEQVQDIVLTETVEPMPMTFVFVQLKN